MEGIIGELYELSSVSVLFFNKKCDKIIEKSLFTENNNIMVLGRCFHKQGMNGILCKKEARRYAGKWSE